MKIAFVVGVFPKLSETFILNQVTGLLDRGHQVDLFALSRGEGGPQHPDVARYGLQGTVKYVLPPASRTARVASLVRCVAWFARAKRLQPLAEMRNPRRWRHEMSQHSRLLRTATFIGSPEYDVIHAHFGPSGVFAQRMRACGVLRGPLLTTFHGYDASSYVRSHGAQTYADLFAHGDAFTCSSQYMQGRLTAIGCDAGRISRFKLGTDLTKFTFRERGPEPDGTVRLLSVGRLTEKKGFESAIPAVAALMRDRPGLQYEIAGDGHLREKLNALIDELGMRGRIRLLGWQDEDGIRAAFDRSHLFLLASVEGANGDVEGQGMVLQEAQAMGLPVICTRHNGFPESILDGRSGRLVPERDVSALSSTLAEVISQPATWAGMGRCGRVYVEAEYDLQGRHDALVELYRTVAAGARSASAVRPGDARPRA